MFHSIVSCILTYFDRPERLGRDKRSTLFVWRDEEKKSFQNWLAHVDSRFQRLPSLRKDLASYIPGKSCCVCLHFLTQIAEWDSFLKGGILPTNVLII